MAACLPEDDREQWTMSFHQLQWALHNAALNYYKNREETVRNKSHILGLQLTLRIYFKHFRHCDNKSELMILLNCLCSDQINVQSGCVTDMRSCIVLDVASSGVVEQRSVALHDTCAHVQMTCTSTAHARTTRTDTNTCTCVQHCR